MKLETTKERVLEAAKCCPSDDRMLRKLFPKAFEIEFDESKIYAVEDSSHIYKLHRVNDYYAFICISNSDGYAWGSSSAIDQLDKAKQCGNEIHTFDTQIEFLKWALKNSK